MNIYNAGQIKKWDEYTIENTPISSLELMENAAGECVFYLEERFDFDNEFAIFCGPGNNGGDGLVIGRKLLESGIKATVYLLSSKIGSREYEINLKRYKQARGKVVQLKENKKFPELDEEVIIDSIFGIGLNKPVTGFYADVINYINKLNKEVISIDLPSGMFADKSSQDSAVICASTTLTFQIKKLAFYMRENARYLGNIKELDIGLLPEFALDESPVYMAVDKATAYLMRPHREKFAHKGEMGHACLIAGSYGMMGAAVLSARGCLRSGVGKLTCYTCDKGYEIMQSSVPEAMCKTSGERFISNIEGIEDFDVIGVGPGIGQYPEHVKLLETLFKMGKPLVIDADALNILSQHKRLLKKIPKGSILTPHPKEFERLFGKSANEFEEKELAFQMAEKYDINIVLKGHHTFTFMPIGKGYINETGNAGMATGGSGDVLTGIITGLLAQKFTPEWAAWYGVFLHGLAGDMAAAEHSEPGMIASDICQHIGKAYLEIEKYLSNFQDEMHKLFDDDMDLLDEGIPGLLDDDFFDDLDDM